MIDLRRRGLPCSIDVDGVDYEVDTDFRTWIEFERAYREDGVALYSVFKGKRPKGFSWARAAVDFLECKNSTPRPGRTASGRAVDLVQDGAYIVAAFQQAYGIDLTACEHMHWHRFKALLDGLPDSTKLSRIMDYRLWERDERKHDAVMRELRRVWQLPEPGDEEAMDAAREIAARLYDEQAGDD